MKITINDVKITINTITESLMDDCRSFDRYQNYSTAREMLSKSYANAYNKLLGLELLFLLPDTDDETKKIRLLIGEAFQQIIKIRDIYMLTFESKLYDKV